MVKKFFLGLLFSGVGIFIAVAAYAQVCPHIYEGINCGANWYCNGCQTTCKTCPGGGDPVGATELNYVSCTCGCPSGKIVCNLPPNTCITPPACSTPTRENAATCNGCGACKAGYAPDPAAPDAPNPCLKAAYVDYANTGTYFQISGDLKSASGDLYLANGKAIRVDGAGTTTLSVGNFTGTSLDLTLTGGLVVKGAMALISQGPGTINAEKLCIQGSCRDVWPAAVSAFVDEGNTGFGPTAVLGTNDNVPLSFEVNNSEKMRIDTAGNVGIGTASPSYKLVVRDNTNPAHIYVWDGGGNNPELDLGNGTNHWAIYRDTGTDQLRFWRTSDLVNITNGGNVGIGITPTYKLDVAGQINANTSSTPAILGSSSAVGGEGVYGWASDNSGINYGGFFVANGAGGYGVYGFANGTGSSGVYGISPNSSGYGIYGTATSVSGTNYGVYGRTNSSSGWGGYFTGGRGAYADKLVAGSPVDPGTRELYVTGGGYMISADDSPVLSVITTTDNYMAVQGRALTTNGGIGVYGRADGLGGFGIWGQDAGPVGVGKGIYGASLNNIGVQGLGPTAGVNGYTGVGVTVGSGAGVRGTTEMASGYGVYGENQSTSGLAYGVYGQTSSGAGWAGYFTGGQGLYASGGVVGAPAGGYKGSGTLNAQQLCIVGDCRAAWPAGGGGTIGGSGTASYLAKFTAGTTIGNSLIYDNGSNVGIGTAAPGATLDVQGSAQFGSGNVNLIDSTGKIAGISVTYFASLDGSALTNLNASNLASGTVPAARLSGSYTGITGVGTLTAGTWNASTIGITYGGTNGTATPMAGGVAYGNGSAYAFTAAGTSGQFLQSTGSGAPTWATIPSGVSGSGTANYLAKFTAGTTVGNSLIYDNGTNVQIISGNLGIGWSPIYKLDVNGTSYLGGATTVAGALSVSGDLSADNNTPSSCTWTAYAASVTCPNGQFVTGVRYSASTVSAYCCEL
jgi:hypothetical protein